MKHLLNCSWPLSKEVNTRRGQVTFRRTIYEQISVKLYNTIYGVSETVSLGLVTRGTTIPSTRRRWLIASITSGERFFLECWYSSNILLTVVVNSYLLEWNRRSTQYHLEMHLKKWFCYNLNYTYIAVLFVHCIVWYNIVITGEKNVKS